MQYFKHFTKMRSDTKIRRLFAKYGLEGYGLYNLILESIAESIETESPLPFLEETCDDIALFYNGNSAKIDEMVRYMIQEGLVTVETTENRIACYKIYKYLEQSQTRSEKIRNLISAYKDSRDILDGQKCLGLSQTKVIEEKRIDKEKNKTKKTEDNPYIPIEEAYSKTYKEVTGNDCILVYGMIRKILKGVLQSITLEQALNVIEGAKTDKWIVNDCQFSFSSVFSSNTIMKYANTKRKAEPIPEKRCDCGGQIFNSLCKNCGAIYDAHGNKME